MKKSTILLASAFFGLLAGTAGNAADPAQCKEVTVKKNSLYAIDFIYKDCQTKQIKTERISWASYLKTFSVDASINSDTELRVVGVGINREYLWAANQVGDGWTVSCFGSVLEPECEGTPVNETNCKKVTVKNDAWYTVTIEYTSCGSTNPGGHGSLRGGEKATYKIQPNTSLNVKELVSGKTYWAGPIPGDKTITCTGTLVYPSCKENGLSAQPHGVNSINPTAPQKQPTSPHGKPSEKTVNPTTPGKQPASPSPHGKTAEKAK